MEKETKKEDPGLAVTGIFLPQPPTSLGRVVIGYYGATPPTNTGQVIIGQYISIAWNPNIII